MPRPILLRKRLSKKNLPEQVHALQQAHPESDIHLWATDQHRIGLKPIVRRIWVRGGSRPRVKVQQRYEWLYVYSFVQPTTGQTAWYLLPSVTAELFSIALALFASLLSGIT